MGKLTPYFLFLRENRDTVKNQLAAAGEATSIGAVGKALGVKWKNLSEEEKQVRDESAPTGDFYVQKCPTLAKIACTRYT
jgi:hypothetical protein